MKRKLPPHWSKRPTGGQKYNRSAPDSPNDQRTRKKAQHQPAPTNCRPTSTNSDQLGCNSDQSPTNFRPIPINSYPLRCLAFCPKLREGGIFQRSPPLKAGLNPSPLAGLRRERRSDTFATLLPRLRLASPSPRLFLACASPSLRFCLAPLSPPSPFLP